MLTLTFVFMYLNIYDKLNAILGRFSRDEETLKKIKEKTLRIEEHRKKKEAEGKKKKKN